VKNEAKTANRFSGVFEQVSAEYVMTASLVIIVLGVILGVSKKVIVLRDFNDLFAAISKVLRRMLASSRSTFFSKSSSWTNNRHFELLFARFLEDCDDVVSFTKNCLAVHFRLNYVNADGNISNYFPDFIVKMSPKEIYIVETKGLEDLDVPLKMQRVKQWCEDINRMQSEVKVDFIYVDMDSFEKYRPKSFRQLVDKCVAYKANTPPGSKGKSNAQSSPTPTPKPLPQQPCGEEWRVALSPASGCKSRAAALYREDYRKRVGS